MNFVFVLPSHVHTHPTTRSSTLLLHLIAECTHLYSVRPFVVLEPCSPSRKRLQSSRSTSSRRRRRRVRVSNPTSTTMNTTTPSPSSSSFSTILQSHPFLANRPISYSQPRSVVSFLRRLLRRFSSVGSSSTGVPTVVVLFYVSVSVSVSGESGESGDVDDDQLLLGLSLDTLRDQVVEFDFVNEGSGDTSSGGSGGGVNVVHVIPPRICLVEIRLEGSSGSSPNVGRNPNRNRNRNRQTRQTRKKVQSIPIPLKSLHYDAWMESYRKKIAVLALQIPGGMMLVTPEGARVEICTKERNVCDDVISYIVRREVRVRWFQRKTNVTALSGMPKPMPPMSLSASASGGIPIIPRGVEVGGKLLRFAQECHLLTSTPGNLSVRYVENSEYYLVTPSGVDKTSIRAPDMLLAKTDVKGRIIESWVLPDDKRRPSVDTGLHGQLYNRFPFIQAILHFHPADCLVVVPLVESKFGFPCGSMEEGEDIFSSLSESLAEGRYADSKGEFALYMRDHGYMIGMTMDGVDRLLREWEEVKQEAAMVCPLSRAVGAKTYPVFLGHHVRGLVSFLEDEEIDPRQPVDGKLIGLYLRYDQSFRSDVNRAIEILAQRRFRVALHPESGSGMPKQMWTLLMDRGWQIEPGDHERVILTSPYLHESESPLRSAMFCVLLNPAERLIYLRKTHNAFCLPFFVDVATFEDALARMERELSLSNPLVLQDIRHPVAEVKFVLRVLNAQAPMTCSCGVFFHFGLSRKDHGALSIDSVVANSAALDPGSRILLSELEDQGFLSSRFAEEYGRGGGLLSRLGSTLSFGGNGHSRRNGLIAGAGAVAILATLVGMNWKRISRWLRQE